MRKPLLASKLGHELLRLLNNSHSDAATDTHQEILHTPLPLPHLKVLVAEDNAVNRMVIKGLLGKIAITPVMVNNGLEVVSAIEQAEPGNMYDLILMDCEMPELDGFDATRRIREYERSHGLTATTIVALTAHALQEHREAVFAVGMDHFLCKPVTLESLYGALEKVGLTPDNPYSNRMTKT